jgi:hypothetical protein
MVQGKQEQGQFDYSDIKGQKINIQVAYVPSEKDFCHEYRNAIKPSQSRGTSSTCTLLSSQTAIMMFSSRVTKDMKVQHIVLLHNFAKAYKQYT